MGEQVNHQVNIMVNPRYRAPEAEGGRGQPGAFGRGKPDGGPPTHGIRVRAGGIVTNRIPAFGSGKPESPRKKGLGGPYPIFARVLGPKNEALGPVLFGCLSLCVPLRSGPRMKL